MTEDFDSPIIEIGVYARRYNHQWYPVGSDTPIPRGALAEPELPIEWHKLVEPSADV